MMETKRKHKFSFDIYIRIVKLAIKITEGKFFYELLKKKFFFGGDESVKAIKSFEHTNNF